MAIIISFLSWNDLERAKKAFYKLPDDITVDETIKKEGYPAQYTNEAPLYYLTKKVCKD